jgi:hypothetical protein
MQSNGKRPRPACCKVIVTNCIGQKHYARDMQEKGADAGAYPGRRQEEPCEAPWADPTWTLLHEPFSTVSCLASQKA